VKKLTDNKMKSKKSHHPKISICILTYKRPQILRELLLSLRELTYLPIEIIVVDNASNDGTGEMVRKEFQEVIYNQLQQNIGIGGRNIAIEQASGEILISLDDDVIGISNDSLWKLINKFKSNPEIGGICFSVTDYFTGKIINWCHHYKKENYFDREFVTDEITEGAVAFRKEVLDKAGLYPDRFFISYEGPDLLIRMLEAGYITIYSPEIQVRHRVASDGRTSWRRYYYDTRNQIWFVARNYPFWWGVKYLCRGLTAMLFYSVRDRYFTYWAKGIWDGIKELPWVMKERRPFSKQTRRILLEIASNRPSVWYMIKARFFQREISI
jgi:GT2 family glycosyltransferase